MSPGPNIGQLPLPCLRIMQEAWETCARYCLFCIPTVPCSARRHDFWPAKHRQVASMSSLAPGCSVHQHAADQPGYYVFWNACSPGKHHAVVYIAPKAIGRRQTPAVAKLVSLDLNLKPQGGPHRHFIIVKTPHWSLSMCKKAACLPVPKAAAQKSADVGSQLSFWYTGYRLSRIRRTPHLHVPQPTRGIN